MEEIRVLSPTGACGAGYLESSFEAALALAPHFIGMDAGSTDPGPSYLGSGRFAFPKAAVKRDIRIALNGARRLGIPLILGSCGTAGGDTQLAAYADIVREIAAEDGLAFKMALIHSEQEKSFLLEKALRIFDGTDATQAFGKVQEARRVGFAMHQRPTHGLSAIASGVFTPSDELVAVMSICALSSRMQSDRLPTLVDCLRRQCAAAGACDFDA